MEGNPSSPSKSVGIDSGSLLDGGMYRKPEASMAVDESLNEISSSNNSPDCCPTVGTKNTRDEEETGTKLITSPRSQEVTNVVQSPVVAASPKQTYSRRKSQQKDSCFSLTSLQASKSCGMTAFALEKCAPQEPAISGHGMSSERQSICENSESTFTITNNTPMSVKGLKIIENATTPSRFQSQVITSMERTRFKEIIGNAGGEEKYLRCRAFILGLWDRDVHSRLLATDCLINNLENNSDRCLLHEIYDFLNYHGFINFGFVKTKVNENFSEINNEARNRVEETLSSLGTKRSSANYDTAKEHKGRLRHGMQSDNCITDLELKPLDLRLEDAADRSETATNNNSSEVVKSPVDCADEESLLDMKNRIKAYRKKKDKMTKTLATESKPAAVYKLKTRKPTGTQIDNDISNVKSSESQYNANLPSPVREEIQIAHKDKQTRKRVIIVGAGSAGLAAAKHLRNMDIEVMLLEARNRVGGRVFTDRSSFSGPVDLGASAIAETETNLYQSLSLLLSKQLDLELTSLQADCPLFDTIGGRKLPDDIVEGSKKQYHTLLDEIETLVAQKHDAVSHMSLKDGFDVAFQKQNSQHRQEVLGNNSVLQQALGWHLYNLETEHGVELSKVSLPYWKHRGIAQSAQLWILKKGLGTVMDALATDLDVRLNQVVSKIDYTCRDETNSCCPSQVQVWTENKDMFMADAVLITVPLGCLKSNSIKFFPPLPDWKMTSIHRLSSGLLNKIVLEFPFVFWDETLDYFGTTDRNTEIGRCFKFCSLKRTLGLPILSTVYLAKLQSNDLQKDAELVLEQVLMVLKKLFGETTVPQPTAFQVTRWGSDPFSQGGYSYVAIGGSPDDYDILEYPIDDRIFFAGEATFRASPNTVDGALISGVLGAVRILDVLKKRTSVTETEDACNINKQSYQATNEVEVLTERLAAAGKDNNGIPVGGKEVARRTSCVQEMLTFPQTMAGRLLLAKEMQKMPDASLKELLGMKDSLVVLNEWIQESTSEDGLQLLRMCINLLLIVGRDASSLKESGIEETVRLKVLMHRDQSIATLACQLVQSWENDVSSNKNDSVAKSEELTSSHDVQKNNKVEPACSNILITDIPSSVSDLKVLEAKKKREREQISSISNDLSVGIITKKREIDQESCEMKPCVDSAVDGNARVPAKQRDDGHESPCKASTECEEPVGAVFMSKKDTETNHISEKSRLSPLSCPLLSSSNSQTTKPEKSTLASTNVLNEREAGYMSKDDNVPETNSEAISEVQAAARAAAEAAEAAAKAYETAEAAKRKQPDLPKILSFHKFAKREEMSNSSRRRPLQRETLLLYGRDVVTSGIDARQSKVRDWAIDFSDTCSVLGSPSMSSFYDCGVSSKDGFSSVAPNLPGISSTENVVERHESCFTSNQDEGLPASKENTDDVSAGSSLRGSHGRKHDLCLASLNSGNTPLSSTPSTEPQKASKSMYGLSPEKLGESVSPLLSGDPEKLADNVMTQGYADADKLRESISLSPSGYRERLNKDISLRVRGNVTQSFTDPGSINPNIYLKSLDTAQKHESTECHYPDTNMPDDVSASSSLRAASLPVDEGLKKRESIYRQITSQQDKLHDYLPCLPKQKFQECGGPFMNASDHIKKAVSDYVAQLLTPLYKTRRIDKETYKSILKKATMKVMEKRTEQELAMELAEFLDTKRKLKIRSLIDKLVEKYLESVQK